MSFELKQLHSRVERAGDSFKIQNSLFRSEEIINEIYGHSQEDKMNKKTRYKKKQVQYTYVHMTTYTNVIQIRVMEQKRVCLENC